MAKPQKKYSILTKKEISFIKKLLGITKIQDINTKILKDLKERLKKLKDSRNQNMIIYKLWDVIMCVILASFACNDTWEEIHDFVVDNYKWLKSFLQMTGGIPNADSYERIIGLVDCEELNTILKDFFTQLTFQLTPVIHMLDFDGRVNNGSKRSETTWNEKIPPLNCLNAYDNALGYCIKTMEISDKSNEIPAVEKMIKGLDLTGIIATWDALNSQKDNVAAVIDAHGDYIVPIKGNHPDFYQNLVDYFDDDRCSEIEAGNTQSSYGRYEEKSHACMITYEVYQTSDIKWYDKCDEWKGLQTFGLVKKTVTKKELVKNKRKNAKEKKVYKEATTVEYRYYISSRQVNAFEFYTVTREHWNIENKIHWHLDFTFCQDKNSTTNKQALLNLEIIHKFVLAVLERVKPRYKGKSLKSIRKHLSNNFEEFFPELVCYLLLK